MEQWLVPVEKNGSPYVSRCSNYKGVKCKNTQNDIEMPLNEDVDFDDDRITFESLFG